ncbi:MAG: hypothetical protein CMP59_00685 [Flavobacteriales bacterium]|nr:hypothetical protein [Flavobacteriales bacterium]|tara:strand:- start:459 stop:827 length:369 start_codon:yes stop_codon:yes gene_type:complete
MDFNIIAYSIYLPVTFFILIWVGSTLFKNGRPFILIQFKGDNETTDTVNRTLLIGYYLINIGYCLLILTEWEDLSGWIELIESLALTIGVISLGLGVIHFINIYILSLLGDQKKNNQPINHL